jgi:hypothetical protein
MNEIISLSLSDIAAVNSECVIFGNDYFDTFCKHFPTT